MVKPLNAEYQCSIDLVIDLIGSKWKVLVLWHLNDGTKRYNELKRLLPSITQKVLTQQLRELEGHGLVKREVLGESHVEYSTTELGKKMQASLYEMCQWGDLYAEEHNVKIVQCSTTVHFVRALAAQRKQA